MFLHARIFALRVMLRTIAMGMEDVETHFSEMHPKASCQRYQLPPSSPRFPIVPTQSLVRGQWAQFLARRPGAADPPKSGFLLMNQFVSHGLLPNQFNTELQSNPQILVLKVWMTHRQVSLGSEHLGLFPSVPHGARWS